MTAAIALDKLRRELPRGPEPKTVLDQIVEQLTAATAFNGLPDKLRRWGWVDEFGQSVPWQKWYHGRYSR